MSFIFITYLWFDKTLLTVATSVLQVIAISVISNPCLFNLRIFSISIPGATTSLTTGLVEGITADLACSNSNSNLAIFSFNVFTVFRKLFSSASLQEKPGGSGRVEGRPPVSFLQLFVKCSPSQNLLGHRTCSTERAPTPPHPGFSTLHSCQPCLPASLWDATHLGVCSSPPNHPHPPT